MSAQAKTSRQALLRVKRRRHRLHVPPKLATGGGAITLSSMTPAMVDRLSWRAGFGPTAEARAIVDGQARHRCGRGNPVDQARRA